MRYLESEQKLIRQSHRVNEDNSKRSLRLAWISTSMLWIVAALMAFRQPISRESIGFAAMWACFAGMVLGYVSFRNRALLLINKLHGAYLTSQVPSSKPLESQQE